MKQVFFLENKSPEPSGGIKIISNLEIAQMMCKLSGKKIFFINVFRDDFDVTIKSWPLPQFFFHVQNALKSQNFYQK